MNKSELKKIASPLELAQYLKKVREEKRLFQKDIANLIGKTTVQVCNIERDGASRIDTIAAYCNAIGLALYIGPADTEPAPGPEDTAPAPKTTAADLQQFADMYALVRPSATQVASFCKYKGWSTDPAAGILADSPAGFVYLDSDNNPKIRMR